ncbi:MAG: asparagine synthase (glutamine-hydrolyzing) [Aggregatilineales bacterium]
MCGIAGILTKHPIADLRERLCAMASAMQHRGPDDEGIFTSDDGRVGLVNRRLAIRDLSPAGHMPMPNDTRSVWITYNGEVYNADQLRAELEQLGYQFRSTSDTEVILKGYEAWGDEVPSRLEGMFAFAIYDQRAEPRLLLARDHMGIKPLYYAYDGDTFLFGSELRTMLASTLISRERDYRSLVAYLRLGSVPAPYTIYRDVVALEPSQQLVVYLDRWQRPTPVTYWQLPSAISLAALTPEEAAARIEAHLEASIRSQLVSDVPLGAFLSGGLDSSAVVGFMRRATTGTLRTCSMVFEEADYSEAAYARIVAQSAEAEHFERVITAQDVLTEFDHILAAMDQPSIDGVNTYFVSQTARQAGLTVALSGLGGDELFGGYPNTFGQVGKVYHALKLAHRVPLGSVAAGQLAARTNRAGWGRLSEAFAERPSLASAYVTRRGLFSQRELRAILNDEVLAAQFDAVGYVESQAPVDPAGDEFNWVSRAELRTYTQNQLLRDTDVMSMAHSLEVRVPFFDTALVQAALMLPANAKVSPNGQPKPLLAQAIKQTVPAAITARRDKQGFTFPFEVWLRGPLRQRIAALLDAGVTSGLLKPNAPQQLFERFDRRQLHWSRLWAVGVVG